VKTIDSFRIPIIAGLWPFESVLNAEFMANEVPGVQVPSTVLERMRRAEGADAAAAEGVAIASDVARGLAGLVQGVHVATPTPSIEAALRVLASIG
jgi:homocysteine S-methyltransferase